ncbi:MAG: hypothetical protein WCA39_04690 [Nitrososphaeraceae archaeon]
MSWSSLKINDNILYIYNYQASLEQPQSLTLWQTELERLLHNNVLFFLSSNSIRLRPLPKDHQIVGQPSDSDAPWYIDILHNGLVTATTMVLAFAVWILMP